MARVRSSLARWRAEPRRGPRAWTIRNTQAGVAAIVSSRSVVNKASGEASR